MESDKQLVEAAVQGDTEAFGALVRKYSNALFAVAYGVLGDFHLAKDVAQETFLKAYLQLSTLSDGNKAGSWLYTIAYRLSLNLKRKRKAEVDIGDGGYEPSDPHDVEEAVLRRETARQVWNVLNTLDETNKIPLILFYISEWSMREIAGFLDISVRAVESRLQRTKKLLGAELAGFLEKELASRKLSAAFEREVMQQIPGLNGIPCIYIRVRDEQASQTWCLFVLETPDLAETYRIMKENSVNVLGEINWHCWSFDFTDPDGNVIAMWQRDEEAVLNLRDIQTAEQLHTTDQKPAVSEKLVPPRLGIL